MYRRFGAALYEFGSTVDIVDKQLFQEVKELLDRYLGKELGFDFYEVLVEGWTKTGGGPLRVLSTLTVFEGGNYPDVPVGDGTSQTAYSLVRDRALWITARDRGLLKKEKNEYVDGWTGGAMPKFPQYWSGNGFDIRTSIIQPLQNEHGAFGVINVESVQCLIPNRWAKEELTVIAKAVAAIVGRYEWYKTTHDGTDKAIRHLGHLVPMRRWKVMERPKLFVAYSDRAREDVVKVLLGAAAELAEYELVDWREREGDGEVRPQILTDLRESGVIVCYLSEPTDEGGYVDNANVLFEAGIAEGLKCAWPDVTLIPVREERSVTESPFDITGLRQVRVPRSADGALKAGEFKKRLGRQLK